MKITFLAPHINISGGVKIILGYANRLVKRGHRVTIVCPQLSFVKRNLKGIPFVYPKEIAMNLSNYKPDWIDVTANIKYVPSYEQRYIPDADIVVATAWQTAPFVKDYSARKGRKFYLIQGYESEIFGSKEEVDRTFMYPVKKIVVATWLKVMLKENFNEHSELILNPVDLEVFYPTNEKQIKKNKRICMLHHISEWKGISDGIKAFEIAKKHPQIQLVMFGAQRKTVDLDCEYHYKPVADELREIYNSCDIFLCPSWREGFGLPSAEAMACKCALVTTDNGGSRDYAIHEKTALVSIPKDPQSLAENLCRFLSNEELLKRIAQTGYEFVQQFTWEKAVNKMEKGFLEGLQQDRAEFLTVPEIIYNKYRNYTANKPHVIEQENRYIQNLKQSYRQTSRPIKNDMLGADNKPQKNKSKTTSIIIPVFNNVEYTKQCLKALIENTPNSPYEVVIVDNDSTDSTKEFLKCLSGSLKVISNAENLGFARACNQGSAVAGGDYLVFLNNDTKVQPGWLEELTKVLQNDSDVGAVGSKLLYPDGSIQHAGVAICQVEGTNSLLPKHVFMQQPSDHIFVNVPMLFQAITAACMMLRKSDFDSVNGFDQGDWNGYEDVDLCFKLTEAGRKIVYQPKSVVLQYESRSSKEERYKRIQRNDRLLQERWAGKIKPDVIISGNQVRQGPSQTIQPYLQNDESVSVSRPEYINALTCWVQKSIVEPIRSPVKKFRFAIKTCTPTRNDLGWGDTPFANSLAKAIMKLGNSCEVQFKDEWNQADKHIDIVIHLRGLYRYTPKPYNRNILWIINHPERQTIEQINQFDLVFCASRIYLERLRNTTKVPCFYLPQATDQEVFNPSTSCLAKDIDLLFVGNRYYKDRRRKIIQDVLDTGKKYGLYVIGQGWHGFLDNEYYKAEYVEWHKLPQLYSRAKIVLNDHHETMSQFGFVNNRTFDLAALKAFQISNYVQGIEEFGIVTYKSPQDLARKLDYFLQNERARKEFANLSNKLCQGHTFANAARRIVDVASKLFNEKNSTKDIQKWCAENATIDSVEMTDVKIVPRLVSEPMETSQQMQDK
jgi:GT2 family glycosyltransferase/spore maturation protein CgeB